MSLTVCWKIENNVEISSSGNKIIKISRIKHYLIWGSLPTIFYETSSTEERQNVQNIHVYMSLHTASETETFLKLGRRSRDLPGQGKTWILNAREHVCSPQCGLSCFSLNHTPFFTFIPQSLSSPLLVLFP